MKSILELLNHLHPDIDFTKSSDFIKEGLLDSFDVILLNILISKEYNINIDSKDIIPENYKNINALQQLVDKYKKRNNE